MGPPRHGGPLIQGTTERQSCQKLASVPIARSLHQVGETWTPLIPRDVFLGITRFLRHQDCGEMLEPLVVCSRCRRSLAAESVQALPGLGGRSA